MGLFRDELCVCVYVQGRSILCFYSGTNLPVTSMESPPVYEEALRFPVTATPEQIDLELPSYDRAVNMPVS